tara:strand:- start:9 stop:170 length:162 start_codon:yes stop_codon:yes gene_type:complete
MAALRQVLPLAGAQDSKISVRYHVSGELGMLQCSQTFSGCNGPTLAAAGFPRQ